MDKIAHKINVRCLHGVLNLKARKCNLFSDITYILLQQTVFVFTEEGEIYVNIDVSPSMSHYSDFEGLFFFLQ